VASFTGTPGVAPASLADLAAVRRALNLNRVPAYGRAAVWDTEADVNFTQLPALINAEKAGVKLLGTVVDGKVQVPPVSAMVLTKGVGVRRHNYKNGICIHCGLSKHSQPRRSFLSFFTRKGR
jgi:hypothetical protein